jgi:hypothetical protein
VLNLNDEVCAHIMDRVRNAPRMFTYGQALCYLEANLRRRPNLTVVDDQGRFVAWDLNPEVVG